MGMTLLVMAVDDADMKISFCIDEKKCPTPFGCQAWLCGTWNLERETWNGKLGTGNLERETWNGKRGRAVLLSNSMFQKFNASEIQ
jgi:hypothetical protein